MGYREWNWQSGSQAGGYRLLGASPCPAKLRVPAIGTGQAWGEEGLSFTDPDPQIRRAAIDRIKSHIPAPCRPAGANIIRAVAGNR